MIQQTQIRKVPHITATCKPLENDQHKETELGFDNLTQNMFHLKKHWNQIILITTNIQCDQCSLVR